MVASYDADQLVIGGNAAIWVAPVGTTLPAEEDDVLDAAFVSLGFTTEDGVAFNDERSVNDIRAHQSFYPIRRVVEGRSAAAEFTMMEWDRKTISLAFGGGTWTEPTAGHFVYEPPDPEDLDERSMVIDIADGSTVWRIVIRRGMVTSNTESTFTRSGPALLPITFSALGEANVKPWYFATNAEGADEILAGS